MARLEDLDDWIDNYLRNLKKFYYLTDPDKSDDREISKLELARLAIEQFWYLQGKLLSWAQAHITGYCILNENPELVGFLEERLGYKINEDSHLLEQIGFQYNMNPPNRDDEILGQTLELLEEFNRNNPGDEELIMPPRVTRAIIRELLMSRCADNSYWRHDLQHSVAALNEGEVDELAKPSSGRRQGLPFSLNRWKLEALWQVRFLVGHYHTLIFANEALGIHRQLSPWASRRRPCCSSIPVAATSTGDSQNRSFRLAPRSPDGWSRRLADVADSGLGRLNWAESAPTPAALGTTAVRAKAAIPLRARNGLHRPSGASLLRHPGFAQAVVHPLVPLDEARIAALFGVERLPCRDRFERPG
jgi:hypothetical protein